MMLYLHVIRAGGGLLRSASMSKVVDHVIVVHMSKRFLSLCQHLPHEHAKRPLKWTTRPTYIHVSIALFKQCRFYC